MRPFFLPLGLMLLVGTGLLSGARSVSRAFLFPATDVPAGRAPDGFVSRSLIARDGVPVHVLELMAPPGARTVVHFHNNRETAEAGADVARALHDRGVGVLLVEYRGYGASRGAAPSEEGLYLDAESALEMLAHRGVGPDRIVLWGTSLGTGVAAEMARRGRGSRLVLVTPYTSIPALVTSVVPGLPARILVLDHFDTIAKSGDIHVPTLVIHGDADEIVPFWMGEHLTRAIPDARLVRIVGGHHGDLFLRDREKLLTEIALLSS